MLDQGAVQFVVTFPPGFHRDLVRGKPPTLLVEADATDPMAASGAISVLNQGLALAAHFGDGQVRAHDLASGLIGAVVKDPVQDTVVWREYLETVVKERADWKDLYRACREQQG